MKLEDLQSGTKVQGVIPGDVITVIATQWHGDSALELTYKNSSGAIHQQVLYREQEATLTPAHESGRKFNAKASDFRLAAEAQRIMLAGLYDPMLAIATSDVQPLPHQIRAVYGELLPRTPLRFLLADDPGAGKTIMAGLYLKELILRDDVKKCLIVAPGGLVDQWKDELYFKFGLDFEVLTNHVIESNLAGNLFDSKKLLIARMDQLSRNEDLQQELADSEWDLVIVDEAHRMGAHYFGGELKKTKRFQLGELLGKITRHFLLMTATPHSGKEEDFQLFLTLLDRDRFEGKNKESVDLSGVMRRMVKEDLLTFEGKKLFPERIAETVPYELTDREQELYEDVTRYVRQGMNRAEKLGGQRKSTVGFALTILQRRLASSPEALYKSLVRRSARLERKKVEIQNGTFQDAEPTIDFSAIDEDTYSFAELEQLEDELLDASTAAQTVSELELELIELAELIESANDVRRAGTDRKWVELSTILQDHALTVDTHGMRRKFIIFTEHRDTLDYLQAKIESLLGNPEAVRTIHGAVSRSERRAITEEFTKNRDVQILIATDAAGEGLNLQAANLMVNYDLPWNPNRIEQRFGRIHRIGQQEVCRLWNLVAANTREGEVFVRLLHKLDQMRITYGGKVFDVLGEAFQETPLRILLLEAIQYGELPETRAKMEEIIDASVGDGLKALLDDRALATDNLAEADLRILKAAMDDAKARRLQPHYIELAFKAAFQQLGGRMSARESGLFEITHVPASVRSMARGPVASKYSRVTFDFHRVKRDGLPPADLIAPGHALHDAVMNEVMRTHAEALVQGTVLVSATIEEPQLLVGVLEEISDATGASVARRFGFAYANSAGEISPAGPAPYLDCVGAPEGAVLQEIRDMAWLPAAEDLATSWIIGNQLPQYLAEVQPRRHTELEKTQNLVVARLQSERDRLLFASAEAHQKEQSGEKPKESAESLNRKAEDLKVRLTRRLEILDQQKLMATRPPRIVSAALVVPLHLVEGEITRDEPMHAVETKAIERRGVELVLASERNLGRQPVEQAFNNKGFDILSEDVDGHTYRIEVKARIAGAPDFFVTRNEVLTGKNAVPHYRLALVRVDPNGPEYDDVRYLEDPFSQTDFGHFDATGIRGDWDKTWAQGRTAF